MTGKSRVHAKVRDPIGGHEHRKLSTVPTGGKRVHPRVPIAASVVIDGDRRDVVDIGLGGFSVVAPLTVIEAGEITRAEVFLPVGGLQISFVAPCQAIWSDARGARGFRFLGLAREENSLLHRVIEDHLAKQVTAVDEVIGSPGAVTAHASGGRRSAHRQPRLVGTIVALVVAAIVLGLVIVASAFTVKSHVAAVAIDGSVLRAPASGLLEGAPLLVGTEVTAGQRLFSVRTPDISTRLAEAMGEQDRLAQGLHEQRVRRGEVKSLSESLISLGDARIESAREKITAIESQRAAARALLERMQHVAKAGYVSEMQVDTQKIAVSTLDRNLQDAKTELAAAYSDRQLAASGAVKNERDSNTQTQEILDVRVASAQSEISTAGRTLRALEESTLVTSPCDCIVQAVAAKPGDVVTAGSLVYTLRPRGAAPLVEALVPADHVHELVPGASVTIAFANRTVKGRLEKVSYDEPSSMRIGLPAGTESVSASGERYAKAVISVKSGIDARLVGTPVEVVISSNPIGALFARIATLFG